MRRSSSPRFGDQVFRRCSRDEFERHLSPSSAFRQEGMGSGVLMRADTESRLVRDGQDGCGKCAEIRWPAGECGALGERTRYIAKQKKQDQLQLPQAGDRLNKSKVLPDPTC